MNKRGRPAAGGPDQRAAIVDAATASFLERGYSGSTLRSIATAAGCDVALIGYYFGSKHRLFEQVVALRVGPADVLAGVLPGPIETMGARIVVGLISVWESPEAGAPLIRLVSQAMSDEVLRSALVGYLERELVHPLVDHLGGAGASERAAAAVTALSGILMARYTLELPTATAHSPAAFAALYAPVVQAALARRPSR